MVMNLDKCIGCHTCSITCKNVWTNREGAEYMYFNNVETKPGIGYPKNWEDQEKWKGGWKLGKDGKLSLRTGSKPERLLKLFYHPDQPEMDDYYEPWTYDYETLIHSKRRNHQPIARPRSLITGERMEIKWGPNWEDDLANGESARQDVNLKKISEDITLEFHDLFMKYAGWLPRLAPLRTGLPLQEGLLQLEDEQGREVHLLLPAPRKRPADNLCRHVCRTPALHGRPALRHGQGRRRRFDAR